MASTYMNEENRSVEEFLRPATIEEAIGMLGAVIPYSGALLYIGWEKISENENTFNNTFLGEYRMILEESPEEAVKSSKEFVGEYELLSSVSAS